MGELSRKVTILWVNEKALSRRYTLLSEREAGLRKVGQTMVMLPWSKALYMYVLWLLGAPETTPRNGRHGESNHRENGVSGEIQGNFHCVRAPKPTSILGDLIVVAVY